MESAAIVPHTPSKHISTLPAFVMLTELVAAKRSWPLCEQFSPVMTTSTVIISAIPDMCLESSTSSILVTILQVLLMC